MTFTAPGVAGPPLGPEGQHAERFELLAEVERLAGGGGW
jgi:hypothetical protein